LGLPEDAPARAIDAGLRAELRERYAGLIREHEALWLQSSRPGGLQESKGRFERSLAQLED
jgi:hypothetical protein